jgi:hypothetical protein
MRKHAKDVASEFLFRLEPDTWSALQDNNLCMLALLWFIARYDMDVRRGVATIQVTKPI